MRKAFTLIELLVVISMIALLIALLLPALSSTRRAVRITACSSNLHQIGISALSYANDQDMRLPLPPMYSASTPHHTRNAHAFGKWYGLGVLYDQGYFDAPIAFYCPSQTTGWLTYDRYTQATGRWELQPSDYYVRVAYSWLPYKDSTLPDYTPFTSYDLFDPGMVLGVDVISVPKTHAHAPEGGWNTLYIDGSVDFVKGEAVVAAAYSAGTSNTWPAFDSAIALFESD